MSMDADDYKAVLHQSHVVFQVAQGIENLPEAIEFAERSLAIGAVRDPTLFREKHQKLEEDIAIMRAVLEVARLKDAARAEGER